MDEPLVVLTTIGNHEQARTLARDLVETRHAACVTCHPGLVSFYRWAGRVEEDAETLLVIKTTSGRLEALKATLLRRHPYEVPELLVLAVQEAGHAYLAWLLENTRPQAPLDAPSGEIR